MILIMESALGYKISKLANIKTQHKIFKNFVTFKVF